VCLMEGCASDPRCNRVAMRCPDSTQEVGQQSPTHNGPDKNRIRRSAAARKYWTRAKLSDKADPSIMS